jgi:hypothetical protein
MAWVVAEDREREFTSHHEGRRIGKQIRFQEIKAVFE